MLRRLNAVVAVAIALGLFASACGPKPAPAAPAPPPPAAPTAPPPAPAPPPPPAPAPAPPAPLTEEQIFAQKTLDQLNAERPLGDIFFNLDESTIRDDARGVLTKNAEYLKRWSSTRINVEGHCDERGTPEYNLGLGERRASAVKAYLVGLGIPDSRITILSKGKESPVCSESAESCWQQNRRGHFVFTAK